MSGIDLDNPTDEQRVIVRLYEAKCREADALRAEVKTWHAIAERDHGAPIETVERLRAENASLLAKLAAVEAENARLERRVASQVDAIIRTAELLATVEPARNELANMCDEYERTLSKLGHYDGCDTDISGTARIAELRKAGK